MNLTKSLFVDYLEYPKLAWWKANNSEVYKKIRKIETEEAEDSIIQIGQAVEDAVKQFLEHKYNTDVVDLMPRYHKVTIQAENDDEEDAEVYLSSHVNVQDVLNQTLDAIKQQKKILYQPTFQVGDCLVRADFMVRNGTSYDLIEAKAKSGIRKDVTDDGEKKKIGSIDGKFINDVSFQAYVINKVLAENELPQLGDIYFAYLNRDYIKQGPLDYTQVIREDKAGTQYELEVTQRNKLTKVIVNDLLLDSQTIEKILDDMRKHLFLSEEEFNKVFPWQGSKFIEYFGENKGDYFGTVMGPGIVANASYIQDLFYQNRHQITDLTKEEIDGFSEGAQKFINRYTSCKKSGEPIIDHEAITEAFVGLQYPICFYDYETISVPIPFMDNTRPYLQTVVQYSLHKYYEDGTMKHYGGIFVGEGEKKIELLDIARDNNKCPFEHNKAITGSYKDLLLQLLEDIGEDIDKSTFVVRYEGFENSRNKEIGKLFPDLEEAFLKINDNTFDLMKIVSEGKYFDIKFKGSSSIKKVMPVLVPSMDYSTLDIGRGDKAMRELYNIISGKTPADQRNKIIEDLLIYCCQDTMAMVKIYEEIKKVL